MVSPSAVYVVVPPGGELSTELVLTPSDPSDTRVTASVDAFTLSLDGEPQRGAGGPRTARLVIAPSAFLLQGGKPEKLSVRYTVEPSARGSFWAVIVLDVESVRQIDEEGRPLAVVTRLAVPVFVTVEGGTSSEVRIGDVRAVVAGGGQVELEATLENVGDSLARVSGAWLLEGGDEKNRVELATSDLKDVLVLPGNRRRIRCVIAAGDAARADSASFSCATGRRRGRRRRRGFLSRGSRSRELGGHGLRLRGRRHH